MFQIALVRQLQGGVLARSADLLHGPRVAAAAAASAASDALVRRQDSRPAALVPPRWVTTGTGPARSEIPSAGPGGGGEKRTEVDTVAQEDALVYLLSGPKGPERVKLLSLLQEHGVSLAGTTQDAKSLIDALIDWKYGKGTATNILDSYTERSERPKAPSED